MLDVRRKKEEESILRRGNEWQSKFKIEHEKEYEDNGKEKDVRRKTG